MNHNENPRGLVYVRRRFDLSALDQPDLERKLDAFCHAVWAQQGSILDVRGPSQGEKAAFTASVIYSVALSPSGFESAKRRNNRSLATRSAAEG